MTLRVAPSNPTAADDLLVRFKTDRNLKPRVHYFFEMFVGRSEDESCAGGYTKGSSKRPRKGRTMTMRLRAVDGVDGASAWCPGTAHLTVYTVKGSGPLGDRVARKRFRITPAG